MRTDIGGARPAGSARHGLAAAGAKPARALVIAGTQGASRRRRTGTTGAIGIGSPRDGHARRTANWGELLTRKIHRRGGKRLLLMALRLCDQAIRPSEEGAALRTQCTGEQLEFHALGRRSVTGRCDGGHISSDGGCLATGGLGARCATPLRRATRSRPRPRGSRTARICSGAGRRRRARPRRSRIGRKPSFLIQDHAGGPIQWAWINGSLFGHRPDAFAICRWRKMSGDVTMLLWDTAQRPVEQTRPIEPVRQAIALGRHRRGRLRQP